MKQLILICCVFLSSFSLAWAHDFDSDIMRYVLSTPDATWSEFSEYIGESESSDLKSFLIDTRSKVEVALELPGKKYVALYTNENPDFSYQDLKKLIGDDPMLTELWVENIYSYLDEVYAPLRENNFDITFLWQTVIIWLLHILTGVDHILFITTLLLCMPRYKRIIWIITTFTIAHCITIVLGGLKIISLPSVLVESMILISIAIMWGYAFFSRIWETKNIYFETSLIFILWLFHGLGFAWFFSGILETSRNIVVPVLGFNLWVELWQILIITLLLSILSLIYKYAETYKTKIKNSLAASCIIFSLYYLLMSFI